MKNYNLIAGGLILFLILLVFNFKTSSITKKIELEDNKEKFTTIERTVKDLQISNSETLKIITDQGVIILKKDEEIKTLEIEIINLTNKLQLEEGNNNLKKSDLNELEEKIKKLQDLKIDKTEIYLKGLIKIDDNKDYQFLIEQISEFEERNSQLQSDIIEYQKQSFKINNIRIETTNQAQQTGNYKKIKIIKVIYDIDGCVFSPTEILAILNDPDGKLVNSKNSGFLKSGKQDATFKRFIEKPGKNQVLEIPVILNKAGNYKLIFSDKDGIELGRHIIETR